MGVVSRIEEALKAADETRALIIGSDILHRVPELFKEQFPQQGAIIVADTNTYRVAGKQIERLLQEAEIKQERSYIFTEPDLYAEYGFVEELVDVLKSNSAIPIAVGSGTINDLTKLASYEANRRYMCVATAASMDGYTAFGASITYRGAKQTFDCPAPQACLADVSIISKAPPEMTASGYADLFAKITAGADWILSDALGAEKIDEQSWNIVQGGLHDALADPKGVREGEEPAIEKLIEGLMLGGFAMQAHKTSRPASGAEHQFSHLWNMEHHTNHGEHISHGFQVAVGTLAITALYELFFNAPIQDLDIQACCQAWPTLEELEKDARDRFRDTDFPEIGVIETKAKYISKEELSGQLRTLKENWPEIRSKLKEQLVPYSEVKRRLSQVGAPVNPGDIGITRHYLRKTFVRAQYIRRRFTILDVAVRTNLLDEWLDKLFGKGGRWES
ncbi:sn-glycerol-1-phosphate dehydrogenase [Proteiniphilum sp. X52]|nr:sn-glycerol-1-phosphate dehydrogenase [Proteiniphilum sp. X52]